MAAEATLQPLDDRGRELLDQLEARTGVLPFRTREPDGARTYYLSAEGVGPDGFDAMLDAIEGGWREHLTRTG